MPGLGISLGFGLGGQRTVAAGGTTVFLLIGQSNMVGRPSRDDGPGHPAGVRQWGRFGADNGQLIAPTSPLQHRDPQTGDMGLDICFSRSWVAQNPGGQLVLVPSADGGTSLGSGFWQPGGAGYVDAVTRANAALAALPEAVFGGFLWHQGESDTANAAYASQLDAMIAAFRTDVTGAGPQTPFVLGQLVPGWVAGNADRGAVQAIIDTTPARVPYTAVASAKGLVAFDGIHFDAASLRTLGARYASALGLARTGQGAAPQVVGQIPDQVDELPEGTVSPPPPPPLAAPATQGQIPDQSDEIPETPLAAPVAQGQIPDQTDEIPL